jgi:hypothetical protein
MMTLASYCQPRKVLANSDSKSPGTGLMPWVHRVAALLTR